MKQSVIVGLDWLEMFIYLNAPIEQKNTKHFSISVSPLRSRLYSSLATISFIERGSQGERLVPYGKIAFSPCSPILPQRAGSLKLENEALYTSTWCERLNLLAQELFFEYRNITRLDLYADFNEMVGGMNPQTFLQKCSAFEYQRVGRQNFAVRVGDGKETFKLRVGSRYEEFTKPRIESITWNSITTGRQLIIYNKSLEQKKAKYKPWIRESWKQAGFDLDNVYRLEMRLTKKGLNCLTKDSGTKISVCLYDLIDGDHIKDLFYSYLEVCAKFAIVSTSKRKRRAKRIELLTPDVTTTYLPHYHQQVIGTSQTFKRVVNTLHTFDYLYNIGVLDVQDKYLSEHINYVVSAINNATGVMDLFETAIPKQSWVNTCVAAHLDSKRLQKLNLFQSALVHQLMQTKRIEYQDYRGGVLSRLATLPTLRSGRLRYV